MNEDLNRSLTRRWFDEVWNQGNETTIDELLAPNAILHGLGDGGAQLHGTIGFRAFYAPFRNAFSNFKVMVEDVLADGDKTVARLTFSGVHTGEGFRVAPTGRPFRSTALVIIRWENGKAAEAWNEFDAAGMDQQLRGAPGMKLKP